MIRLSGKGCVLCSFPNLRIGDDTFGSVSVAFFEKMDLLCRDIISKVLVEIGITPSLRELLDPFLPQNNHAAHTDSGLLTVVVCSDSPCLTIFDDSIENVIVTCTYFNELLQAMSKASKFLELYLKLDASGDRFVNLTELMQVMPREGNKLGEVLMRCSYSMFVLIQQKRKRCCKQLMLTRMGN